jgi:hypothetical protein
LAGVRMSDMSSDERRGWLKSSAIDRTAREALELALEKTQEERDVYRALLDEFASHRWDSTLDWFDGWTRRVHATLNDRGQS